MLAGVLSERNLGFNLGFAYVMFLIHPNIYRCCNFFKMREKMKRSVYQPPRDRPFAFERVSSQLLETTNILVFKKRNSVISSTL